MRCVSCRERIPESEKRELLAGGEWRVTRDEEKDGPSDGSHGYRISGLYSPWRTWSDCALEFQEAKRDPSKLKVWVNHVAAETWEETGTSAKKDDVLARARREPPWEAEVPRGVGILVMAVDVQGNRLEVFVWGFGAGEESWFILFEQIIEDPGKEKAWFELEKIRTKLFRHQSGQTMRIERTVIDTRGGFADQVYEYCAAHRDDVAHQVHAIYGTKVYGKPLVDRFTTKNKVRVKAWPLCVNTGKDTVMSRLQIRDPGPGYIHLPPDIDEELVNQLTAEKGFRKYVAGEGWVTVYRKERDRNEALDGFVYATAALHTTGKRFIRTLGDRAEQFAKVVEVAPGAAAPSAAPRPDPHSALAALRRPRRSWVNRWRH
jgi:phage terminase large subunit GpA-like protein